MSAQPNLLDLAETPRSLTARLAQYFRERPYQWIDGRVLATVAGAYGWRTRTAECRKPPYNMTIENEVQRVQAGKSVYRRSRYRWIP